MTRHTDPRLQFSWNSAQLGLLIFPFIPFLGAVALGLALVGTWWRRYRTIIRRPLNWGLALLSILLIISASFAYHPGDAFLGLFNFLPFFIFFAAFSTLIQTTAQLRQLAWILVVPSVPVVIIGLGQLFFGWTFKLQLLSVVLDWGIAPGGAPPGRMASILGYANVLAAYLVITFILALGLWIEAYQQMRGQGKKTFTPDYLRSRKLPVDKGNFLAKLFSPDLAIPFLTVAVISNFCGLILTNSRNAWAIAIIACLVYALYQGWRWLVASVMAIAASVLLAAFAPSPVHQLFRLVVPPFFWARLTDQLYPDRPLALMRKTQWQFAWALTQQRPWTGWGLRNFTSLYESQMQIWLGHPHNLFLMLSAETGIPATLLFCGLVAWVIYQGFQVLNKLPQDKLIFFSYLVAFLACALFNTVDVTIFDFRVNMLSWLLLSAIGGIAYQYKKFPPVNVN